MAIKDIETLEIDGSRCGLEAMTLDDVICIEVENDGEFINGYYTEEEARRLRGWLNEALAEGV